ncbi:MAG: metalloregulator ArsR/SmtB family transcription factor [Pseudomonadota bacterium]
MTKDGTYNLDELEQLLRAAGEQTRLRLLYLCSKGEHTVSDLVSALHQSQPRVSRHLKILCDAGLLERYRDGHWVYFRVPHRGREAQAARMVLSFLSDADIVTRADLQALNAAIADDAADMPGDDMLARRFHRLVIDQFLSAPVGELLDIGAGSGAMLKLLAGKASSAHGVDIDPDARRHARRAFVKAELTNCTVRPGDMYRLDFPDARFDTVVLDEVLLEAADSQAVLTEALRVMRANGRLLVVEHIGIADENDAAGRLSALLGGCGLRCGPVRRSNDRQHKYLVAMAQGDLEQLDRQQA